MSTLILAFVACGAGFVASVFIWPRLRQIAVGVENEIDDLRAKASALETKLRG